MPHARRGVCCGGGTATSAQQVYVFIYFVRFCISFYCANRGRCRIVCSVVATTRFAVGHICIVCILCMNFGGPGAWQCALHRVLPSGLSAGRWLANLCESAQAVRGAPDGCEFQCSARVWPVAGTTVIALECTFALKVWCCCYVGWLRWS